MSTERGRYFWYFIFDDGRKFETSGALCYRLEQMTHDRWVSEARSFLKSIDE